MSTRHAVAVAHLRSADPTLGAWIDAVGPCGLTRRRAGTHFDAIARAIVYQQLSGKAAATIHGRLRALYDGRNPTPDEVLRTPVATLRGVGLSGRKTEYLRDLAARARDGALPIDDLHRLDNDAVLESLTAVRGIGEWTAQMFLMFRLGRPDVLPVLDLGVQKAIQMLYRMRRLPSPERVAAVGKCWAPHRTVAAWYLWRRVDAPPA